MTKERYHAALDRLAEEYAVLWAKESEGIKVHDDLLRGGLLVALGIIQTELPNYPEEENEAEVQSMPVANTADLVGAIPDDRAIGLTQRLAVLRATPVRVQLEYRDPSDIRNVFGIIGANAGRYQQLAIQIAQLLNEAQTTDRRCCGNCEHWMKSKVCPREKNVNGYSRGPSCNDYPCNQFDLKDYVRKLKDTRFDEVEAKITELEAEATAQLTQGRTET